MINFVLLSIGILLLSVSLCMLSRAVKAFVASARIGKVLQNAFDKLENVLKNDQSN